MQTDATRYLLYLRAGPQQRFDEWRIHHHPLGPGACHRLQPLRGCLAGRIVQQHADGSGSGVLDIQALGHTIGPVYLIYVRVDQHLWMVDFDRVAGGLYDGVSARHEDYVRS